jgi:signal transduction histidine kinase
MIRDGGAEALRPAILLPAQKEALMKRWTRRVLDDPLIPGARRLSESALRDHIPVLLDQLLAELTPCVAASGSPEAGAEPYGETWFARDYAHDRFNRHYSLAETLRELSHLRSVIIDFCAGEGMSLSEDAAQCLHLLIDEVMSTVAVEMEQVARADQDVDRRRLRSTLRLFPAAVFIFDAAGRMLETNTIGEALWGSSAPCPRHLSEFGRYQGWWPGTGSLIAPTEWPIARALLLGEEAHDREIDILCADGERKTILNSAVPLRSADGGIIGGISVAFDITERVQATRKVIQTAELRDRFIGILGHDLRNPLSSINVAAAVLLKDQNIPEAHAKILRKIISSVDRMSRMISDLLDLTRGHCGQVIPIAPKPCDLRAICRQMIEEIELVHPTRSIELQVNGTGLGVWDPDRLAQALGNLLGNAISYSLPETPIRVALSEHGANVILTVSNLGLAIPPELQGRIFEPFQRGVSQGEPSTGWGLGLGLYITQQIVKAHGGSIWVTSEPGTETIFTISLPR